MTNGAASGALCGPPNGTDARIKPKPRGAATMLANLDSPQASGTNGATAVMSPAIAAAAIHARRRTETFLEAKCMTANATAKLRLPSRHFDLDKLFQGRKNVRAIVSARRSVGQRWTRVFLTEKKRCEPTTFGQLVGHEEVMFWNVLQVGSGEEQRILQTRSWYELEDGALLLEDLPVPFVTENDRGSWLPGGQ